MPSGWPRTLLSIALVTAVILCRPLQCSCLCDTTSNWNVLMALYSDLGGANWTSSAQWDVSSGSRSACRLYGITCDNATGGITSVVFPSPIDMRDPWNCAPLGLRGTLPALFSQWNATLVTLRFCNQQGITGTIPSSFAALSSLLVFHVGSNRMSGTLPPFIGTSWQSLKDLYLYVNSFTGTIPESWANLTQLKTLDMNHNSINGTLPPFVGMSLCSLTFLNLDTNSFTGTIPESWGNLSSLWKLYIPNNMITGTIPSSFAALSSLVVFYAGNNKLNGTLPPFIGTSWQSLQDLYLHVNSFTGTIPESWANLTQLKTLDMNHNSINGTLPPFVGMSSRSLTFLSLDTNSFTGTIPESWGNLSSLWKLYIPNNMITGTIPGSFAALSSLVVFYAGNNKLNGTLPPFIGTSWQSLQDLYLHVNSFSGTIPESWANLTQLKTLHLSHNHVDGTLPSFIGVSSRSLTFLSLDANSFTGTIPESWGNLTSLVWLYLPNNMISGTIPSSLAALSSLDIFHVSGNKLNGTLPAFIGKSWHSVRQLVLYYNSFTGTLPESWGTLPALTTLSLTSNIISGTIPSSFAALTSLVIFRAGSNSMVGILPSFIGRSWRSVQELSLDDNSFFGTLPPSWGLLRSLATLQLQGNSLSGSLPSYWGAGLPALGSFSVNGGATRFCGGVPATWGNRSVLVAAVAGIVSPQCGHNDTPPFYSFVAQANASLASCEVLCSVQLPRGFVATPTSAAENALLAAVLPSGGGRYLLGGSRGGTPDYRWVSGPLGREDDGAGALLFAGGGGAAANGTAVMFSAFAPLQPSAGGPQLFVSGGGTVGHLDAARGQWFNGDDAGDGCVCQAAWRSMSRSASSRASWSVSRSGSMSATASCSVSPSSPLSASASRSLLTSMSMSASILVSRSAVPSLSRSAVLLSTTATGGSLGMTQSTLPVTATHTLSGTSSLSIVPAPSRLDTRAPVPAISATTAASAAAAATAALSSTVGASSVVALVQLGVATSRLSHRCDAPLDADGAVGAAPLDNPLHLSLASLPPSLQFAGGAVVGNTLLLCLLGVLGGVLELGSEALRCGCDLRRLAFLVRSGVAQRLPGLLMSPLGVVLQPTLAAAVSLLASADRTAGTVALGCLGVAAHGGLALWMCVRVHGGLHCLACVAIDSPAGALLAGGGVQSWLSSVELRLGEALRSHWRWTCAGDGAAATQVYVRYAPCFEEYRRGMPMYFAFELCVSAAAAVATGLGMTLSGAGSSVCDATAAANWALLALAVLQLGVFSYLRPMGVPLSNYLMVLFSACNAVATVLSIAVDSATSSWFAFSVLVLLCAVNTARVGLAVWVSVGVVCRGVAEVDADGTPLSLSTVMEFEPLGSSPLLQHCDVSWRLGRIIAAICEIQAER